MSSTIAYLKFPFAVGSDGPAVSERSAHLREQIEQVLFTNPGERVFRPEFGAGVRALVFEPNDSALWEVTRKRLEASLAEALRGEVDPRSIQVGVEAGGAGEQLVVSITYTVAAIGHREVHRVRVFGDGEGDG